jgi:hypothetical protein
MMRLVMIILICFAVFGCTGPAPRHVQISDGGGGGGGAPPAPEMRGHPVRGPSVEPICKHFEADNTCHSDRPIAVVCDDNEAPPECELHNLAPDYFCCPP